MNRDVAMTDVAGKQVFTIFTRPDEATDKLVIMAHGFRGGSTGPARSFVNFEGLLLKDGFACLRFDQPHSGNSEGDFADSSSNSWIETIRHLARRYLDTGFRVALLGQSMGATATMVAAAAPELRERIPCLLLWVPDPKSTYKAEPDAFAEEAGQRYRTQFWREAAESGVMQAIGAFPGAIHLVYGEDDVYVSAELRHQVIEAVQARGHPTLVLKGEGHSSWAYDVAQFVFAEEQQFLLQHF